MRLNRRLWKTTLPAALALAVGAGAAYAQNPCAGKNPCAAKKAAKKSPCAANPCAAKKNPCAANPCAAKKK